MNFPTYSKKLSFFLFFLLTFALSKSWSQNIPIDPMSCGYACSASDVLFSDPYFADDITGTVMEPCDGDNGQIITGYICFTVVNTTGTLRYTPMLYADLNINGTITTLSECFPDIAAGESTTYCTSFSYTVTCGDSVKLENMWTGWNVSKKDCGDISTATTCNKLIPSGKCGDYNTFPVYISMPVKMPNELGAENTIERCSDGFDNDGNSLVDCDDMNCVSSCEYTSTSGGNDGGLESNGRLAEKVNKRYYNRVKQNKLNLKVDVSSRNFNTQVKENKTRKSTQKQIVQNFELIDLIPVNPIPNADSYNSTPDDLIGITNATQTLAVDYFEGSSRKAAVLAIISENGVYEHTKAVCDRVSGSEILNIWEVALYKQQPLIISKLKNPNGSIEYGSTFSFYVNEQDEIVIENHWNVSDYTYSDKYYNFQVWADNTLNLQRTVNQLLDNIEAANGKELKFSVGAMPDVFVKNIDYKNDKLNINLINKKGLKSIPIKGLLSESETQKERVFYDTFELTGEEEEQIQYDTEGVYTIGFTVNEGENTVADNLFFADGVWGYDIDETKEKLTVFETYRDFQSENENDLYIERGAKIRGTLNEKFVLYRSISAKFGIQDLSGYQGIAFEAKANKIREMVVRFINPEVSYENQVKAKVVLNVLKDQYYIDFQSFEGDLSNLSNISMMIFEIPNWNYEQTHFVLELTRLRLTNSETGKAQQQGYGQERLNMVYPNPVVNTSTIAFESNTSSSYEIYIYDITGKPVYASQGNLTKGLNRIDIYRGNHPAGNYSYMIIPNKEREISGKLIMK